MHQNKDYCVISGILAGPLSEDLTTCDNHLQRTAWQLIVLEVE